MYCYVLYSENLDEIVAQELSLTQKLLLVSQMADSYSQPKKKPRLMDVADNGNENQAETKKDIELNKHVSFIISLLSHLTVL